MRSLPVVLAERAAANCDRCLPLIYLGRSIPQRAINVMRYGGHNVTIIIS